jgi:hypothetical protein
MEALFDLLARFERLYRTVFDNFDLLLAKQHPAEEQAERLAKVSRKRYGAALHGLCGRMSIM